MSSSPGLDLVGGSVFMGLPVFNPLHNGPMDAFDGIGFDSDFLCSDKPAPVARTASQQLEDFFSEALHGNREACGLPGFEDAGNLTPPDIDDVVGPLVGCDSVATSTGVDDELSSETTCPARTPREGPSREASLDFPRECLVSPAASRMSSSGLSERMSELATALDDAISLPPALVQKLQSQPCRTRFSAGGSPYPEPGELEICTLMCLVDLAPPNRGEINLEQFATLCHPRDPSEGGIIGVLYGEHIIKGVISKPKRTFGRQVQLNASVGLNPHVSVKVFHNAKLQITGCKELDAVRETVAYVIAALHEVAAECPTAVLVDGVPNAAALDPNAEITIVNANCTYDCGAAPRHSLVPERVLEVFASPEHAPSVDKAEYDTELQGKRGWYPGVKVYLRRAKDKPLFVGVFCTGKVIITGAHSMEEAKHGYEVVSRILYDNYEYIRGPGIPEAKSSAKKRRRATRRVVPVG
mmetsp:Transcript_41977/g.91132  ORF Transcript_41977/g.91132 Transcript_41977/m.91132 type:complete len:469 (-) Transcript_41977:123-1529(-)